MSSTSPRTRSSAASSPSRRSRTPSPGRTTRSPASSASASSREAQTAGILSHPNIVTIHDIGEDAESHASFIAMEYIEGRNLKSLLTDKTKFSWDEIADLVAQIAEALDYAHRKGIIHRDIKPANIILTTDSQGEDHRLRDRQGRVVEPDDDRAVPRHAELHVSRAGLGRAGGRPQRHLLARRRALRAPDGPQALPGRQPHGDLLQDRPRGLHAAGRAVVGDSAGVQPHRRASDGQGSLEPVPARQGSGPRALSAQGAHGGAEGSPGSRHDGVRRGESPDAQARESPGDRGAGSAEGARHRGDSDGRLARRDSAGDASAAASADSRGADADAEPRGRDVACGAAWPGSRADRGPHEHGGRGRGPDRGFLREPGAASAAAASAHACRRRPPAAAGAQEWKKLAKAEVNPKWFWRVVVGVGALVLVIIGLLRPLRAVGLQALGDAGCGPRAGSPRHQAGARGRAEALRGRQVRREPREIPPGPRAQPQQHGGPQVRADGGERRQEPAGGAGSPARRSPRSPLPRAPHWTRAVPTKPRRRPRKRWRSIRPTPRPRAF